MYQDVKYDVNAIAIIEKAIDSFEFLDIVNSIVLDSRKEICFPPKSESTDEKGEQNICTDIYVNELTVGLNPPHTLIANIKASLGILIECEKNFLFESESYIFMLEFSCLFGENSNIQKGFIDNYYNEVIESFNLSDNDNIQILVGRDYISCDLNTKNKKTLLAKLKKDRKSELKDVSKIYSGSKEGICDFIIKYIIATYTN